MKFLFYWYCIDMCKATPCPGDSNCVNTYFGPSCQCKDGYFFDPISRQCKLGKSITKVRKIVIVAGRRCWRQFVECYENCHANRYGNVLNITTAPFQGHVFRRNTRYLWRNVYYKALYKKCVWHWCRRMLMFLFRMLWNKIHCRYLSLPVSYLDFFFNVNFLF